VQWACRLCHSCENNLDGFGFEIEADNSDEETPHVGHHLPAVAVETDQRRYFRLWSNPKVAEAEFLWTTVERCEWEERTKQRESRVITPDTAAPPYFSAGCSCCTGFY